LTVSLARSLAALVVAIAATGCLERKEAVRVHEDGSVDVVHELTGDPAELDPNRPDALPHGAPWTVEDRVLGARERPRAVSRLAFASFARADAIPTTNGAEDDPAPLRATTRVAIEPGDERGTIRYVFERRYAPRAYRWRERLHELTLGRAPAPAPGENLTADEKRAVAPAARAFEREVSETFLDQALAATSGERADGVVKLRATAELQSAFAEKWTPDALLGLETRGLDEQRRFRARFLDETARDAARGGTRALLGDSPMWAEERELVEGKLRRAYVDARRTLQATETLLDESFEVRVELPCPIALTNGSVTASGETAIFRFTGRDLCDREHVLRAVGITAARDAVKDR
jgi:hypothetical protein